MIAPGFGRTSFPQRTMPSQSLHAMWRKGREDLHIVNPIRVAKPPALSNVHRGLADRVPRVTASSLGGSSAVARTTVNVRKLLVQRIDVVTELTDLRARYCHTRSYEMSVDNAMCISRWSSPVISIK
jgi:hypothetical protein